MRFYLGTHEPAWLSRTTAPLFVSTRRLERRKSLPRAAGRWALDSGGFTELSMYGQWQTSPVDYAARVRRYADEIGGLDWAAPQDWMCEPFMLAKTGLTVAEHQARTIRSVLELRQHLGALVVPVLQGYTLDDYQRHADDYTAAGFELEAEATVGLGSVCRRQATGEAERIVHSLAPLRLHGFGMKTQGLDRYGAVLASADSMAWSYNARRHAPLPGCSHRSCANCPRWAMRWRGRVLAGPATPGLWGAA